MTKNTYISGLKPTPSDERDFALGGVFGYLDIKDVPTTDFRVSDPLVIKDQGDTDYCSAYASTSVSEDQEGKELCPHFQFFATKRISGNQEEWGADLRSTCKSLVNVGSIKESDCEMAGMSREYILDAKNWKDFLFVVAGFHKKATYFKIDGRYDLFDNIRCALWKHRDKKNTILTGINWRYKWIDSTDGIIKEVEGEGFGHAFKIFGQKVIDGEIFLEAQLSNGKNVGDNGLFYLNREVVNKEIEPYGAFMFDDISREEAEYYLKQPFTKGDSILDVILGFITNIFK